MYIHAFAFRWNENVKEEQKARAKEEILALQGQIPGLLETHVGTNFSERSRGYDFVGVMKFTDRSAMEAYFTHPVHQQLVSWLMHLIEPVEMDFEATSSSKPYPS